MQRVLRILYWCYSLEMSLLSSPWWSELLLLGFPIALLTFNDLCKKMHFHIFAVSLTFWFTTSDWLARVTVYSQTLLYLCRMSHLPCRAYIDCGGSRVASSRSVSGGSLRTKRSKLLEQKIVPYYLGKLDPPLRHKKVRRAIVDLC